MAEAEAGLELPIGLTEQKFLQQLARIEAKAIKASNAMAKKFVDDNKHIGDSFKSASDSADVFTRELDSMRSEFDPLFSASKRYEATLGRLNRAHKMGAIDTQVYEAQLEQLNQQMAQVSNGGREVGSALGGMSGQTRASLQNVSYQLQDIFVQIQGGQGATRALSQQLPQLASGFGVVGGAIGLVAALAIPLAASFLSSGEEAKGLDEAVQDLNSSLSDYYQAVEAANVPTTELAEKYGLAAGAARELLEQLAQIAKLDAASALRDSATSIRGAFEDIPSILALVDAELQEFGAGSSGIETLADSLREKFGLTIEQARELQGLLSDQQAATSVQEQADAMLRLAQFLGQANEQAGYTNDSLIAANRAAAEGALAAQEMAFAIDGASVSASDVAAAVASIDFSNPLAAANQLSGVMGGLVGQAQGLLDRLGAAAKAARARIQSAVSNGNALDPLGAFGGGQSASGAVQVNAGGTIRTPVIPDFVESSSGGGGGGRSARSGGAGAAKLDTPFFANAERDITMMQRQIELIGKTSEEVATAKARWELLDEAKRRGIPVNAELSAQIDAQAAGVGRLTGELERAEATQQQFEDAVDGIADAMAGALVAGESLREGLAQVFKQIASDILNSGIRNALSSAFGGGGFNPFALFGGGGDALTGGLRAAGLPARAMGGPVRAGQPYLIGERGPEIMVPGANGTVIPNHKMGGGGESVVMVQLSPELKAQILAEAEGQSVRISQQTASAQAKALPGQVQRISANPRRR